MNSVFSFNLCLLNCPAVRRHSGLIACWGREKASINHRAFC